MVLHDHGEIIALWGVNEVSHKSKFHLYLTSYTMFYVPFFNVIYVSYCASCLRDPGVRREPLKTVNLFQFSVNKATT